MQTNKSDIIIDNAPESQQKAPGTQEGQVQVVASGSPVVNVPVLAPVQSEFLAMMERLIVNKDVDLDRLKQMREMYNDEQDRQAEKAFYADFVLMKPKLPRVIKLHNNTQTKSMYAKLEDINDSIEPILGQFGFGTSMDVIEQNKDGVKVRVDLIHTAGHIKSTTVYIPIDDAGIAGTKNKTMPHAFSSSIMYARRVGECALLNISTGDDIDGNQLESATDFIAIEKIAELESEIKKWGGSVAKVCAYMKVEELKMIKLKDLQKVMILIGDIKKQREEINKKKEQTNA